MNDPDNIKELFARYARLRQSRSSREDAWKRIKDAATAFTESERQRLLSLIRDWEIIEGHRHKPAREDDPHATLFAPPEGLRAMREQAKAAAATGNRDSAGTRTGIECPVCHQINAPGMARCDSCGALLPQTKDMRRPTGKLGAAPAAEVVADPAQFGDQMALRLEIVGAAQPVDALPGHRRIVVGRKSPGSVVNPDIDLSPYEAEPKGVSRFHASLYRQDNTLVLTDLRSLNHTYINGLRLYPHEVRVLRDGDEVRFGQLTARVRFRAAQELATTDAITPAAES
jgi:hypothetical protein